MSVDIKDHVAGRIRQAASCYTGDLHSMSDDLLAASPGGVARTPYDFTYEIVFVNRRIAKRIRGEEPEPFEMKGWIVAPPEFQNKDRAIEEFRTSTDEVLEAWEALAEDQLDRSIPLPQGEPTTPIKLASLCASHITYHDAQLNYLQAINGDGSMHWD